MSVYSKLFKIVIRLYNIYNKINSFYLYLTINKYIFFIYFLNKICERVDKNILL